MPKQDVAQVGMRLGRYQLDSELGEGGMASVFAATDTKLGREVAVKVLFPHLAKRKEAASRFKREARAAAALDHEHILRVLDVGGGEVVGNVLEPPYIVLERIDGSDLGDFFAQHPAPMSELVAAIGVAMCDALELAHQEGIVHRDIKPANIMVSDKGRLVLADFGVARVNDEDSVVTRTGALLGTPAYMSPEQATGDSIDSRTDIYSLGATLYKIATASLPYGGGTAQVVAAILADKKQEAQRIRPEVGGELSRVIEKMMHREADKRYASATEAKAALLEICTGGGYPDTEALLVSYFSAPEATSAKMPAHVVSASIKRAAALAARGRKALALSLGERVLLLDPDNIQARALVRNLVSGKTPRVWVAVVGPMVVTGAVAFVFWGYSPGEPAPIYVEDAGVEDAAQLSLDASSDTSPMADASILDAGTAETAAWRVKDASQSTMAHSRVKKTPVGQGVKLDAAPEFVNVVRVDASVPTLIAPLPKADPALLVVNVGPWCDVWIDGVKVGRASPRTEFSVPAGTHQVKCLQETTQFVWNKSVTVSAGEKRTLVGSVLPQVKLTTRLTRGDSVKIDGKLYGKGTTRKVKAGRHRVQVFKDGKAIADAQYVDIRKDCILRDSPNLGCFKK